MISIISVNWNSYEFLQLLLESCDRFTRCKHDVIIVDNSTSRQKIKEQNNLHVLLQNTNIGHGAGLNEGIKKAIELGNPYVMFVDVDCHFLSNKWHDLFISLMNQGFDVIGGKGVPEKPIRPSCMFMKLEVAKNYDYSSTPGYKGHRITPDGFDVAIQAYHNMTKDGINIQLIDSSPNRYGTLNGEEWEIDSIPILYHHWHGTHLIERGIDFPNDDLIYDKNLLFSKIPWRIV